MDEGRQVALQLGLLESFDTFLHCYYTADAITRMHVLECRVDFGQRLSVGNEFVHLQLAIHVVCYEVWELCAPLDASKGTPLPHPTCDKLESWSYESVLHHMPDRE